MLVVFVINERYREGMSHSTSDAAVRREVIHRLALGSCAHSEFGFLNNANEDVEVNVDSILSRVATYKFGFVQSPLL